jgi:hypothetical protein
MRKLLTAVATATVLLAISAITEKAEAATLTGVGSLPLANSYAPVEKVRRCVCGPYGCACGRRVWKGYKRGYYGYGYRPYGYYGYGYRPYRWRY